MKFYIKNTFFVTLFIKMLHFFVTMLHFCYTFENPQTLDMTGFEGILLHLLHFFSKDFIENIYIYIYKVLKYKCNCNNVTKV